MRKIEAQISSLSKDCVDAATRQILQNLVDKKKKISKYSEKRFSAQIFTFITLLFLLMYIYITVIQHSSGNIGYIISSILSDSIHVVIILIITGGYATALYFKRKEDKAESEFHLLRCEVVRRSTDYWPQPKLWEKRYEVLNMMKNEFDINLFHEGK